MGAGPIGLFIVLMAKVMGASDVVATDISPYRLDLARKAGADFVFNPLSDDVVERVRSLTAGVGVGQ